MQPSITRKEIEEIIKPFENRFRNSTDGQKDTILELIGDSPENIELCKTIKYDQAKALIAELYRIQEAYLEETVDKEAPVDESNEEHAESFRYECAICNNTFNKPKKKNSAYGCIALFIPFAIICILGIIALVAGEFLSEILGYDTLVLQIRIFFAFILFSCIFISLLLLSIGLAGEHISGKKICPHCGGENIFKTRPDTFIDWITDHPIETLIAAIIGLVVIAKLLSLIF